MIVTELSYLYHLSSMVITLKTKNVSIECTATDLTKAKIVLNTMVTMFSGYCENKFEVEPVDVVYSDGKLDKCPDLSLYDMKVPLTYINESIGISLEANEIAMNGFTEVLTWILCSHKENFDMLNRKDDKSAAVIIGNPRSADFEMVRTSLMPGILKTVGHNKDHPKPIKIFEIGDVALLDASKDVGARNRRQLAALYCGANSGFEIIHSLVDRIMEVVGTPFVSVGDDSGYYIKRSDSPEFLLGRQADIIYKGKHIGTFGIVHPEVLENFDITFPCSYVELNMESFL